MGIWRGHRIRTGPDRLVMDTRGHTHVRSPERIGICRAANESSARVARALVTAVNDLRGICVNRCYLANICTC